MTSEEYEARRKEYELKADHMEQRERILVEQANMLDARARASVARYDAALADGDKAGIEAYMVECQNINEEQIRLRASLAAVRAEFDALSKRRPRRTWAEFLGLKARP